MKNNDNSQIFC